jgi:hypothetical protein
MGEPLDNPRAMREAQRRFDYDRRNHGIDQAMLNMQGRNAVRRQQDRRAAERKVENDAANKIDRVMRENPRLFNGNSFSD